ncbi:TetR family transcriptional regulator [Paenibacillus sp. XY044]|uniref:TetR family transcriptional regulator n=1 Tax=Paenibacillus sp. XY044 TaxID=2026089 RepID=UPI00211AA7F8|nr:TetR family transcriptional regulator [Paenibacillus sp. XY044]
MNPKENIHPIEAPAGLRERKKRLAQAAIEEAALRLFQQKGYEQTSIQDIADAVTMSSRTFFRYYASKEEVLSGPIRSTQLDGIRFLQEEAPPASPHAALRSVFSYLAGQYQQQRPGLLLRYRIAGQTPSIASLFLYTLMETEPTLCHELSSRLESAVDRNEVRFLVAVYMAALRVSIEEWMEQEDGANLVDILYRHMDRLSSMPG